MAKTVNCPNCDAILALDPTRPTLHCDYCKSDVTNPAHASPIVGATPRKGKAGLIVGLALGGVLVLGGALGAWLLVGVKEPTTSTVTATTPAVAVDPMPAPALTPKPKRGVRVRHIINTADLTGDGIGDLAFSSFANPKVGGLESGGLGVIDGKDGKLLWHKTYPTDARAKGTRTACHDVLVVQDNTRSIIAFEGQNGAQRWRLTLSDYVRYSGRAVGTKERPVCLFATVDKAISAVDAKAGKLLWRHKVKSPWGLREVLAGDDTALFKGSKLALDLHSGEPRKTGIRAPRRYEHHPRSPLSLVGARAYYRPRRDNTVQVFRTQDWKKLGRVKLPKGQSPLRLWPQDGQMLAFNAYKPPVTLARLDGAKLHGPLTIDADEKVLQARVFGETIVMLTVTYEGTRKTTLRAFDLELTKELWNAQLDASGKTIKFPRSNGFGGLGGRTSGRAGLAVVDGLLLMELAPVDKQFRLSVRDLRSGKVLGEINVPMRKKRMTSRLSWLHAGPKRAFIRTRSIWSDIVALDPATRKVVWTYALR